MTPKWWHFLFVVAIGYTLAYYMPQLGDMTLGKIYARKG